jgi:RNA-binding protein
MLSKQQVRWFQQHLGRKSASIIPEGLARAENIREAPTPIMIPNSPESLPAPELASYQRKALRGLANPLRPIVHVGEAGVSGAVLRALDEALLAHELVKVRLFAPENKKATARAIADKSGAALCGLVGHTVILYRPHPENPRIQLPERPTG